jgi:hypothetical protein
MRIFNPTTSSGGGGEIGATGPAPWTFIGAYDNGYSYNLYNAVTYLGGYYYRTGNPLNPGYPPTPGVVNESWTPVADGGEQGATGPQGLQGPGGGGGAGGLMFYLNQNTSPDSPIVGLPTTSSVVTGFAVKELGRIADTVQTTITTEHLPINAFNLVAGFVSDVQDPNITTIPPGLWDLNFWASSTANANNQTVVQVKAYVYNGATLGAPFATSDELYIYDPTVVAQYTANLVVGAGVTITSSDRIYIEIWAKGSSPSYTLTLKFGAGTPTHLHTTIPSVSGTGIVKVENGLFKTPASLIVNADIATNAAIAISKISGLQNELDSKALKSLTISAGAGLTGGGDLSTSRTIALATTGISALTYGSSSQIPSLTVDVYGRITAASSISFVPPNVQTFPNVGASQWTKPPGAKRVRIQLWSGAGGGASGRKGPAGAVRGGGGGGGSGAYYDGILDASILGDTEIVTIGAGGNGASGQTSNNSNGNNGIQGGTSSFGSHIVLPGGNGGFGGTNAGGSAGGGGLNGNAGGAANASGLGGVQGAPAGPGSSSTMASGGGAAGAGLDTGNTSRAGSTGGRFTLLNLDGGAGGVSPGGNGGNGQSISALPTTGLPAGGSGGGSGSSNHNGNAGAGGAGGWPAAGGGGGGAATDSVGDSGAGGPGGAGAAIITTYFYY